jgi:hypothetical protein
MFVRISLKLVDYHPRLLVYACHGHLQLCIKFDTYCIYRPMYIVVCNFSPSNKVNPTMWMVTIILI